MRFDEFIELVSKDYPASHAKHGKSLMIWISKIRPDIYQVVAGTDKDCYYDIENIERTKQFLKENW